MARVLAADIEPTQVCLGYDEDANFTWHQRVLLIRLGTESTRWVAAAPDGDVNIVDLADHRVVPLTRNAPVPIRVAGDCYVNSNITEAQLAEWYETARSLASIVGGAGVLSASGVGRWRFADTAHEEFGEEIPQEVVNNPGLFRSEGAVALAKVQDQWTFAEKVADPDLVEWKEEKRSGPGRDTRVLAIERDNSGNRYQSLRGALTNMVAPTVQDADWPFRGPSCSREVLEGIRATGEDLSGYHEFWLRSSGASPDSSVAHHHRNLLGILMHLVCYDQLDGYRVAGVELICRHILHIQRAVKKNPRQPDFRGLEITISSKLDSPGGLLTGEFARYVAEEQKAEAFTLKQQRLYAEEASAKKGAKPGKDGS